MKNFKKSWIALLLCLIACLLGVCLAGCNKNEGYAKTEVSANDDMVAITVVEATPNTSLIRAMECAQDDGNLSFTIEKGMVTSINGVSQTTNVYWMLYTSDTDNANTAWGTCEYGGQTLGSATLGAESLTVKNGCVYVWVYTKF
ncbi:MAG: hypothetical protein ACI4QN_00080 [Candidatus Coproplasma sp.]